MIKPRCFHASLFLISMIRMTSIIKQETDSQYVEQYVV